ncbi:hypothetical protein Ddc_22371 [Ditylenchus destructor]|nr:hypothetical protein Ddc_22371 [Ditylenchus destructor]
MPFVRKRHMFPDQLPIAPVCQATISRTQALTFIAHLPRTAVCFGTVKFQSVRSTLAADVLMSPRMSVYIQNALLPLLYNLPKSVPVATRSAGVCRVGGCQLLVEVYCASLAFCRVYPGPIDDAIQQRVNQGPVKHVPHASSNKEHPNKDTSPNQKSDNSEEMRINNSDDRDGDSSEGYASEHDLDYYHDSPSESSSGYESSSGSGSFSPKLGADCDSQEPSFDMDISARRDSEGLLCPGQPTWIAASGKHGPLITREEYYTNKYGYRWREVLAQRS